MTFLITKKWFMKKIIIGADHRGFKLKQTLINYFKEYDWNDVGTDSEQRTDYPIYAQRVCQALKKKEAQQGILICGSGIGASIAANRVPGIYAALVWSQEVARVAKEDDGANVLVLPADFVSVQIAIEIIKTWLGASFKGGHYQDRLDMIDRTS